MMRHDAKFEIVDVLNGRAKDGKRLLHKLADRVSLSGSQDEILRSRLLQDAPHALDVVAR